MGSSSVSASSLLLLLLSLSLFICSYSSETATIKDLNRGNPVIELVPSRLDGYSSSHGGKDVVSCGRVRIVGVSRLKIKSYANSVRVTLVPSVAIPERFHNKIEVCFHRNASLGLCQCSKEGWKAIQNGMWNSFMSSYEDRYMDVKFIDEVSGSVTVTTEEEFQRWRLLCLAVGFILLLLAPVVSNWVPFYYSSSMAIGVFLVILILLFQGMKLLPTGRKNVFYLTIYGSVLGAGSFLLHYFSMLVNSILVNFGLNEDMHNPVSIFVLVGVILAGAALGYWIVRKFVISEDGSVDIGIAQFVKWAMRILATTSIFQSTLDTPLAIAALAACWGFCFFITYHMRQGTRSIRCLNPAKGSPLMRKVRQASVNQNRAEFLSRSAKMGSGRTAWNSSRNSYGWSESPVKGLVSPSSGKGEAHQQDYYSTFHKTPTRKRFSKKEWDDFTHESTRQAMAEWASSPEFADWIIENADRVQVAPVSSSDESMGSGSDSSEETMVGSSSGLSLFKWY